MKKNYVFIILSVAVMLVACGKKEEKKEVAEAKSKVKLETVTSKNVAQTQEFTATVEPENKNSIAPTMPGRIRKIYVEVGDKVAKGQKLVQMDNANLNNSESQIENLRRVYNRVKGLFAVGGASQQELDNAKVQLDVAETNLKNLNENTVLVSPISGVVTARNLEDGDLYNGQQPVLTVMQISPVKLKINVSESFYNKVKIGMPVDVKVELFEGETFNGKVSLVYPTIDERTRTFGVEVKIANNNSKVRPGMFARVFIDFGTENRVVVSDRAILKQTGSSERYVYVYADGKVSYRKVELGQRLDAEYELISGLTNGESVVVSGHSKLNDNSEVEVIK